jgi:hypothetical protein
MSSLLPQLAVTSLLALMLQLVPQLPSFDADLMPWPPSY